ncbi:MAG: glycosyltransferase family 4 protein [Chloroflexi bacterium]|nr:glycosyltransferase family 4 protein [Chloroflexota bacterium]
MRVGLITGEYPPMQGGIGAYTRILAHSVAALGHEVHVLSRVGSTEDEPAIHLDPLIGTWDVRSLGAIRAWARGVDVVNLQYQTAAFDMSPIVHFLPDVIGRTPVVTTFHDLRFPYLFPKAGRLRDWIVAHLAKSSNGVIATNHEDALKIGHLPCTALIPIGSNILKPLADDFDAVEWRRQAGAGDGDFLLAYFGLINRSKGLEPLLKCVAKLRAEHVPARLIMIGNAGSSDPTNVAYMEEIDGLIERLELAPYIHRLGYIEDDTVIGAYLTAADAVVLPFADGASYRRGSLMAAIRYGCPTVTTIPRVHIPTFQNQDNLLLVTPDDPHALTHALHRLYESPQLRVRLKQGAAALALDFGWSEIARDTVEFYERVIKG